MQVSALSVHLDARARQDILIMRSLAAGQLPKCTHGSAMFPPWCLLSSCRHAGGAQLTACEACMNANKSEVENRIIFITGAAALAYVIRRLTAGIISGARRLEALASSVHAAA